MLTNPWPRKGRLTPLKRREHVNTLTDQILVVDDEPTVLAAMRSILDNEHPVIFATNGLDAINLARDRRPGLIFLGLKLPDLDGYAVCCALMADPLTADIPVIIMSTQEIVPGVREALSLPSMEFVAKPVTPSIIMDRVQHHLRGKIDNSVVERVRQLVSQVRRHVDKDDDEAGLHPWRMASYAVALAQAMDWDRVQCAQLELAAALHDVGKLKISRGLLGRKIHRNIDDWNTFTSHTTIGHEMLANQGSPVFDMAATIALNHHEKWDGTGYPAGLSKAEIPQVARIVAIADVFDAMTMDRPGKPGWAADVGFATLNGAAGTYFDPAMVTTFNAIMPKILKLKSVWDHMEARSHDPGMAVESH